MLECVNYRHVWPEHHGFLPNLLKDILQDDGTVPLVNGNVRIGFEYPPGTGCEDGVQFDRMNFPEIFTHCTDGIATECTGFHKDIAGKTPRIFLQDKVLHKTGRRMRTVSPEPSPVMDGGAPLPRDIKYPRGPEKLLQVHYDSDQFLSAATTTHCGKQQGYRAPER